LPTIRAWWEGSDILLRERLHLFPDAQGAEAQREQRVRDRRQLLRALKREGLLGAGTEPNSTELMLAVHAFVAKSSAFLAMAQVDDIAGEIDPVNLPASLEYPNWRRRLSVTLEQLFAGADLRELAEIFARERGIGELDAKGPV
jgi:4-alpha-glucanotransferase